MTTYRYINETDTSASYGLAADEYLLDYHSGQRQHPATLRLYNYADYAVLAGRFQALEAEIDVEACRALGFGYSRRLTGGGAILMGRDQLGICLATAADTFAWEHVRDLYRLFSQPVIDALTELGIAASFRSKNDLEVNGKKIAGLGVHVSPSGSIQFHTSLLLDLDINIMLQVLKIPLQKFSDKRKIASVRQRITTIRQELGSAPSMPELKALISKHFARAFGARFEEIPFNQKEKEAIAQLETSRYKNEEWLFQRSPQADMNGMSLKKTPAGLLRTYIALKGETIKSVMITGDFFEQAGLFSRIEAALKWSALDKEQITKKVAAVFAEMSREEGAVYGLTPDMVSRAIWLAAQRAMAALRYTYKGSCYYPKEDKNQVLTANQ